MRWAIFALSLFASAAADAAPPPVRLAGDSLPLLPEAARGSGQGRATAILRVSIAESGQVEKATVVRASQPALGSFLTEYVKANWRFSPPHDASGHPTKVAYMQAFNFDLSQPAVAERKPVAAEPEPQKDALLVRDHEPATNEDALPAADMPTAGAMRKSGGSKVTIDPRVLKVLTESQPAFRECADTDAVVKTSFVIGESGAVSRAHVRSSTVDDTDLERCILDTLSKLTFPKPRGGSPMLVLYPVVIH